MKGRAASRELDIAWLGLCDYKEALELQRALVLARIEERVTDILLLLEHYPVITIGTGGDAGQVNATPDQLRRAGLDVVAADRGGGATLHGPGQLVAYPIVDLRGRRDLHGYLRGLETAAIRTLADYGLQGRPRRGLTGVWVGGDKVASVGVRAQKWVTSHGLSINVANDLKPYALIKQCGLEGVKATSIKEVRGAAPEIEAAGRAFAEHFAAVFGYEGKNDVNSSVLAHCQS
jgi:lipoate-protein ligase B